MGFSVPARFPAQRWALTPPFHPCLRAEARRRFVFCGTFRQQALKLAARAYPMIHLVTSVTTGCASSRPKRFSTLPKLNQHFTRFRHFYNSYLVETFLKTSSAAFVKTLVHTDR